MIDIKGYENIYAIDRDGRVWSYKSKKYIKQWIANTGYYMVRLHKNGKQENKCVHRILAEAFIENPNKYQTVDHIDRDKLNNSLSNLRWASYTTQNNNMDRTLNKNMSAERCKNGFVNPLRKVIRIDKNGETVLYNSLADAAFDTSGDRKNTGPICKACRKELKTYRGYIFEYVA